MERNQQDENLQNIRRCEDKINTIFMEISSDVLVRPFFLPDDPPILGGMPELKFRKMISYLYKLLIERCNGNLKILKEFSFKFDGKNESTFVVVDTVHGFRTMFEHYLLPEDKHSINIKRKCMIWYRGVLSKNCPQNDEDWDVCFDSLSREVMSCLENAAGILSELRDKEDSYIYEQWAVRQKRNIPRNKKISFLEDIKKRYALSYDSKMLYQKYQSRIDDVLNLLDYNVPVEDIDQCIYNCLETLVLSIKEFPCPLSGKEVEDKYNIHEEELEKVMRIVTRYYKNSSCIHTKESLYDYIETSGLIALRNGNQSVL